MKTIFDHEFKSSRALGAYVPFGGIVTSSWTSFDGVGNYVNQSEAYRRCSVVYICVHEIATSAASVPFEIKDKVTGEVLKDKRVQALLDTPNPNQDRSTFLENFYALYLLRGNVGIEAAPYQGDAIDELYVIPFDQVEIILNKRGGVNAYEVISLMDGTRKRFSVGTVSGRSKFLHARTFNPNNPWIGISPLEALGRDYDIFQKSGEWNQALLKNSARPSGVFVFDDGQGGMLGQEAYDRLDVRIKQDWAGESNAGTPILLEGGLDWKAMSLSPVEMDFLNSRAASARLIASGFGYPAQLLGIEGDNTYNNQKEARLALWTDTIMPLVEGIANKLTTWFSRLEILDGNKYSIVPNYDNIGALQPVRDAIWEKAYLKGKDFMTVNERRKLVNLQTLKGYDGIVANAAQVPLTYALTSPEDRKAFATVIRDSVTKNPNN